MRRAFLAPKAAYIIYSQGEQSLFSLGENNVCFITREICGVRESMVILTSSDKH